MAYRVNENDLEVIENKRPFQASRQHLGIGFSGGSVYVRDRGSSNGIFVSGMRLGGGSESPATFILEKKENSAAPHLWITERRS